MTVAMWQKALTGTPHVGQAEWAQLDLISRWLISTRAAVLIMTLIPCLIAGLLAVRAGHFDALLFALTTLGLIMAHATNNLLNDLVDFRMGVDKDNYFRTQYGVQPIESGLMSMRENLLYAAVTGGLALACGLALIELRGGPALTLTLIGAFFVLFYTWPLKYIGLGEIAVLLVWGPLMTGGGYFVISGEWSWTAFLAGVPYGLGATGVIFGKHIDKLAADRAKHIRTLPVMLGERLSRYTAISMLFGQYAMTLYLIATGYFSPLLFSVLFAVPVLWRVIPRFAAPRPERAPEGYPVWPLWYVTFGFVHNRAFGLAFLSGLAADTVLHRLL